MSQSEKTQLKHPRTLLCALLLALLFFSLPPDATGNDEAENIKVYEQSSRSVVNIINSTVRYDSFYRAIPMEDYGAGVVIDRTGRILTSLHLIDGALKIEVELFDGTKFAASIIGIDRDADIALLRINAPKERLYPVRFSKAAELKVGARVLAIGNPFGLDKSLTVGIVSSASRRMRAASGFVMEGLIQTDAATNPGSSGGPLLNSKGEMVGLNSAIFSPVQGSVGIGLAIPVSIIENSLARLESLAKKTGYVPRVWIGFTGQDMDKKLSARLKYKKPGILVAAVFEGGPAYKAGVKGSTGVVNLPLEKGRQLRIASGGDYILDIDGERVEKMRTLNAHVAGKRPGEVVTLGLLRGKRRVELRVTLLPRPRLR